VRRYLVLGLLLEARSHPSTQVAQKPVERTSTTAETVQIQTTQFRDEGQLDELEARVYQLEAQIAGLRPTSDPRTAELQSQVSALKRQVDELARKLEGNFGFGGVIPCLKSMLERWRSEYEPNCNL
jgi:small-conductance mechanosensitive channel